MRGDFREAAATEQQTQETLADDARLMGVTLVIDGADAPAVSAPTEFFLWPENAQSFEVFCAVQTQWDSRMVGVAAFGVGSMRSEVCGLKYPGVDVVLRHRVERKRRAEVLSDIQIMERAALDEFAAAMSKKKRR